MDESESWFLWGQTATPPRHQAISHASQSLAVCRLLLRQEGSASGPGSQPCMPLFSESGGQHRREGHRGCEAAKTLLLHFSKNFLYIC